MYNINLISQKYLNGKKEKQTEQKAFLLIKSDLKKIYEQGGISKLLITLTEIYKDCIVNVKDAEVFAKGFFTILAGNGDKIEEEIALFLEKLVNDFPKSVKLTEMLADVYGEIESPIYEQKLADLTKNNPLLINANYQYIQKLYYQLSDFNTNDNASYLKQIEKIKQVYIQFPFLDFAQRYVEALKELSYIQNEEDALLTIDKISELLILWKDSFIESHYFDALCKFTRKQDKEGCTKTIEKLESFWNTCIRKDSLATHLAYSLANYSLCVQGREKEVVLQKIKSLATFWNPAAEMASQLANGTYLYAHKPQKAI